LKKFLYYRRTGYAAESMKEHGKINPEDLKNLWLRSGIYVIVTGPAEYLC